MTQTPRTTIYPTKQDKARLQRLSRYGLTVSMAYRVGLALLEDALESMDTKALLATLAGLKGEDDG